MTEISDPAGLNTRRTESLEKEAVGICNVKSAIAKSVRECGGSIDKDKNTGVCVKVKKHEGLTR